MHGDFSFDPLIYRAPVSRVLFQQGRVQLDSDANEATAAIVRYLRLLARDVIGPHGGPGFRITAGAQGKLVIGDGFYYVDGIRVQRGQSADHDALWPPSQSGFDPDQPYFFADLDEGLEEDEPWLIYLDVWERHISAAEEDRIREPALLGPDTASRAVIVWQVRALTLTERMSAEIAQLGSDDPYYDLLRRYFAPTAQLRVSTRKNENLDACAIAPDSRYRGVENRLYRVEVHAVGAEGGKVYLKWSPDNGSSVYPIRDIAGPTVDLESTGRDERTAISVGDWVEVVDDQVALMFPMNPSTPDLPRPLLRVEKVDRASSRVTLSGTPSVTVARIQGKPVLDRHPILRRWATQIQGVNLDAGQTARLVLSDGVEVELRNQATANALTAGSLRPGDYWIIPTRTATGEAVWPAVNAVPQWVAPHGIDHHYAPLARWTEALKDRLDLRKTFVPLTALANLSDAPSPPGPVHEAVAAAPPSERKRGRMKPRRPT